MAHYLDIDKTGHFNLMRHDAYMAAPKYFTGNIPDTLIKKINETFANNNFKTEYLFPRDKPVVYCGFTYCIDYREKDSTAKKMEFVPDPSPASIQQLQTLLDTLVYTWTTNKIDTLNLTQYSKELEIFFLRNHPLPPLPKIELRPPKINLHKYYSF